MMSGITRREIWHGIKYFGTYEALRAAGLVPEHVPMPLERPGKGQYLRWKAEDGAQWSLTHCGRAKEGGTKVCACRSATKVEREAEAAQRRQAAVSRLPQQDDLPPYMTPALVAVIRMRRDVAFQAFMARAVGTAASR